MASYKQFFDLAVACHDAPAALEKDIVGAHLPGLAYRIARTNRAVDEARLRELSERDACLQAVVEIIPESWGYMLSRGYNGRRLASVFCPLLDGELTMQAKTEALALLGALATTVGATADCEEVQG